MERARAESEFCNGILCFRLTGEIDHHTAPYVREQMDKDLWFYRPKSVILILDGIEFMDSSGLGLILGRYNKAKELGATVKIENPTAEIEKILKLAGVERLIPIVRTENAPAK